MRTLTREEMTIAAGGSRAATVKSTVGAATWGGNPPGIQAMTVMNFAVNQVRAWLGCPVRSVFITDSIRPGKGKK